MNPLKQFRWGFAALALLCACDATVRAATTYSLVDLGAFPTANYSTATAINDKGQVTGSSGLNGFVWTPNTPNGTAGAMYDIGHIPNYDYWTQGVGINDFGQIVGWAEDASGSPVGQMFLWTPSAPNVNSGTIVNLGKMPGFSGSMTPGGINNQGQIVGTASGVDVGDPLHAFLWNPSSAHAMTGSFTDLHDQLGTSGTFSAASKINAMGQVAATTGGITSNAARLWTPNVSHGTVGTDTVVNMDDATGLNDSGRAAGYGDGSVYFPHNKVFTPSSPNSTTGTTADLGYTPGGDSAQNYPVDINNSGQMIIQVNSFPQYQFFLWSPSTGFVNLQDLLDGSAANWTIGAIRDINDLGQIIGEGYYDPDGPGGLDPIQRAILLQPDSLPEPASGVALLILMAGAMAARRRFAA